MRSNFLVAVEIFFISVFCAGCDCCRTIDEIVSDLRAFFAELKKEKAIGDVPSLVEKIGNSNKELLCFEEIMYGLRGFSPENKNKNVGMLDFCKGITSYLSDTEVKGGIYFFNVLFLNLYKIFFISDKLEDQDISDFENIFSHFCKTNGCENLNEALSLFLDYFYALTNEESGFDASKDRFCFGTYENGRLCKMILERHANLPFFCRENGNTLFYEKKDENYKVFFYGDFVVLESIRKNKKKTVVWKRERRNKYTSYSFYWKLSDDEVETLKRNGGDKALDNSVIGNLKMELWSYMFYEIDNLCRDIDNFIKNFHTAEDDWFIDIMNTISHLPLYINFPQDGESLNTDQFLKYEEWESFLNLKTEVLDKIEEFFKSSDGKGKMKGNQWFKGLTNYDNTCFLNALMQNLFDFIDELKGVIKESCYNLLVKISARKNIKKNVFLLLEEIGMRGQNDIQEAFNKMLNGPYFNKRQVEVNNENGEGNKDLFVFEFFENFQCFSKPEDWSIEIFKDVKSIEDILGRIYKHLEDNYVNLHLVSVSISTRDCPKGKTYKIAVSPTYQFIVSSSYLYEGLGFLETIRNENKRVERISGALCAVCRCDENCSCSADGCQCKCDDCKEDCKCSHDLLKIDKTHNLKSDFFIIYLKRFDSEQNVITNHIPIPDHINFDGVIYDVTGVACQFGSANFGHYVTFKKKFGIWFCFNDIKVLTFGSELPEDAVENAYFIFLKKHDGKYKNELLCERRKKKPFIEEEKSRKKVLQLRNSKLNVYENGEGAFEQVLGDLEVKKGINFFDNVLGPLWGQYFSEKFKIKNENNISFEDFLRDFANNGHKKNKAKVVKDVEKGNEHARKDDGVAEAEFLLFVKKYYDLLVKINLLGKSGEKNTNKNRKTELKKEIKSLREKLVPFIVDKEVEYNKILQKVEKCFNKYTSFLDVFMKVFFKNFYKFFNGKAVQSLSIGEYEIASLCDGSMKFVFEHDEFNTIPVERKLPFFIYSRDYRVKEKDGDGKNEGELGGVTRINEDNKDRFYCLWPEVLVIADAGNGNGDGEENNVNLINDDMSNEKLNNDTLKNCVVYKKICEVDAWKLFQRDDNQKGNYKVENFKKRSKSEKKMKLLKLYTLTKNFKNSLRGYGRKISSFVSEDSVKVKENYRKYKEAEKNEYEELLKFSEEQMEKYKFLLNMSRSSEMRKNIVDRFKRIYENEEYFNKRAKAVQDTLVRLEKIQGDDEKFLQKRLEGYLKDFNKKGENILGKLKDIEGDIQLALKGLGSVEVKDGEEFKCSKVKCCAALKFLDKGNFDLFINDIERELKDLVENNKIFAFNEYIFCGVEKRTFIFDNVFECERWFKGLRNLGNTCYVNSLLQSLIEFKDDIMGIQDCDADCIEGGGFYMDNDRSQTVKNEIFAMLKNYKEFGYICSQHALKIADAYGFLIADDPQIPYDAFFSFYKSKPINISLINSDTNEVSLTETGDGISYTLASSCSLNDFKGIMKSLYDKNLGDFNLKNVFPLSKFFLLNNEFSTKNCGECGFNAMLTIYPSSYCNINVFEVSQKKISRISQICDTGFRENPEVNCDECKKPCVKKTSTFFRSLNNCLCFKFTYSPEPGGTVNHVNLDEEIKIDNDVYELTSVCYYKDYHYMAYKRKNGFWFKFDDSTVSFCGVRLPDYVSKRPVLVFYKKKIKDDKTSAEKKI